MTDTDVPRSLLIARVAGRRIAVDATCVLGIRGVPHITRLPHSPPALLGVFHHDGRVVPLLDLPLLADGQTPPRPRVIVIGHDEHDYALVVDDVEDVVTATGIRKRPMGDDLVAYPLARLLSARIDPPKEDHGENPQEAESHPGEDTPMGDPATSARLVELLQDAPEWMRRIHLHDDQRRINDNLVHVQRVLGDGVYLLDLDSVWRAVAQQKGPWRVKA